MNTELLPLLFIIFKVTLFFLHIIGVIRVTTKAIQVNTNNTCIFLFLIGGILIMIMSLINIPQIHNIKEALLCTSTLIIPRGLMRLLDFRVKESVN